MAYIRTSWAYRDDGLLSGHLLGRDNAADWLKIGSIPWQERRIMTYYRSAMGIGNHHNH